MVEVIVFVAWVVGACVMFGAMCAKDTDEPTIKAFLSVIWPISILIVIGMLIGQLRK